MQQPKSSVCKQDKPCFDDQCSSALGLRQKAHLRWTRNRSRVYLEEFVLCQERANKTYSEAKSQLSDRNMVVLMNALVPRTLGSSLKSAVFGFSSSLPPLVGGDLGQVPESVGKADLLPDHFNGKKSMASVDLPLTCRSSPRLATFAVRSIEVSRLLLDIPIAYVSAFS